MNLLLMTPIDFEAMAEDAHMAIFGEFKDRKSNRFDFVILVEEEVRTQLLKQEERVPVGLMACKEIDAESVWILYGGAFEKFRKTSIIVPGFHMMIDFLRTKYKRVRIDSKTSNIAMIKLAYSKGFEIVGVENQLGEMFVNMELKGE